MARERAEIEITVNLDNVRMRNEDGGIAVADVIGDLAGFRKGSARTTRRGLDPDVAREIIIFSHEVVDEYRGDPLFLATESPDIIVGRIYTQHPDHGTFSPTNRYRVNLSERVDVNLETLGGDVEGRIRAIAQDYWEAHSWVGRARSFVSKLFSPKTIYVNLP